MLLVQKLEIAVDEDLQYRYVMCGEGYLSQNSLVQNYWC